MKKLKIRNLKDKAEIDGLVYCVGENEPFSGIFVENKYNGNREIKECYSNGIITKKLEFQKMTIQNNTKLVLSKSMVYREGKLYQTKNYKYDKYGKLKGSILEKQKIKKLEDKAEIDGLVYCVGENEPFSGIFVENKYNGNREIKECYSNGIITKKLEFQKMTIQNNTKLVLSKSMVYREGKLYQTKNYKYDKYGKLKGSILEKELSKLKIRNLKDKAEIDGLVYCIGENEPFSGIFVEKVENILEGHEIKETYDNGIILKKERYNRFNTREKVYKMFLVESIIYQNGELFQKKTFEYNKYGELKKEIIPNVSEKIYQDKVLIGEASFDKRIVKHYDNSGNTVRYSSIETYEMTSFLKKAIPIIVVILLFTVPAILNSNLESNSKNYNKSSSENYYKSSSENYYKSSSENYYKVKDDEYMKKLEDEVKRQLNDPEIRRQLEEESRKEIEKAKREMNL